MTIISKSQSLFWESVTANIQAILAEDGEGSAAAKDTKDVKVAASNQVIPNPMSGIISVKATQKQHLDIQNYLDRVLKNSLRQVLIEATIVEVELSQAHQSGVDWSRFVTTTGKGPNLNAQFTDPSLNTRPFFLFEYQNPLASLGNITAAVRLLETFGDVKVLSSPKIMALNNQSAILKVVDEKVYFTVSMQSTAATDNSPERQTFTSEIHTVPVGVIMTVTPQINENDMVALSIRPTITRITGFATDPAPRLVSAANNFNINFDNLVPEIQIREMESLLHVFNGRTIVLGGLMQEKTDIVKNGIPILSRIPWLGRLFSYQKKENIKTELVIFLRPQIIKNQDQETEFSNMRNKFSQPQSDTGVVP